MNRYIDYLKDNPEGYWFKRKIFGWGWTPATWQGWAITIVYLVIVIGFALTIDENSPGSELIFTFFLPFVLLTLAFIRIAYKTGEKPKWTWGFPKKEDDEINN